MNSRFFALALSLLATAVVAQEPEVTSTAIKGNLYLLQGRGGNVVTSVGADGALLIDSDYANFAPAYQRALEALGQGSARFVINTHWHSDHAGGNDYWGDNGGVVIAHDNVRQRVSTEQVSTTFGRTTPASPPAAWPMVTYADSVALHFNGNTIEVQHYPAGHTDGDSVVFFVEQNVVHMGDHFFKDRFPFVDLDSGGSVDGFIDNVTALLDKIGPDTVVVPGHGSLAKRADLERYLDMLISTRAEVAGMRAQGLDSAAVQARGLSEKWETWGAGFINEERWISFLLLSP
jgi:cyclase